MNIRGALSFESGRAATRSPSQSQARPMIPSSHRLIRVGVFVAAFVSSSFGQTAPTTPAAQADMTSRPFIWTRLSEREGILQRIRNQPWAAAQFSLLQKRADTAVAAHRADRSAYLRQLPLETSTGAPKFVRVTTVRNGDGPLRQKFAESTDCAAMFYLTGEERYARCAADILHNALLGYANLPPTADTTTGGWIYSNGLLGEASESGMYLPVVYDYLFHYLKKSPLVFQLRTTGGAEIAYAAADFARAQTVFRTYYALTRDRGLANNNWSPNMAKSLVPCALALDDPAERNEALKDYLERDNERQTSLRTDATRYPNPGDIWPESLDYSAGVNRIHPYLMVMLDRYDPSLRLFELYPNVAQGMARPFQLVYPNGRQIHFGDFHRDNSPQPYFQYEIVYAHAQARNLPRLRELYGPLINAGIAAGKYDRSGEIVKSPLPLFWFADAVTESAAQLQVPRTDVLSHAGIALQRNLSPTGDPVHGLMGFVGGGAHVHSHANGMNIELYGQGTVLGVDAGKGDYKSDLHENYYRLFAGHNTVIVNGASGSAGGWVNLGINTVQVETMEPRPNETGVAPNLSFTCSTFLDDRRAGTEATQQRVLGIVRTSPTTGYYVDVFRSRSRLPDQFHDYLYHNIGETLALTSAGGPLDLQPMTGRFVPAPGQVWKQNESYLHPGWHHFKEPQTSAVTAQDVVAEFSASALREVPVHMRLFIPGLPGRDYTRALAPESKAAAMPYAKQPTPVLVIRQQGEAWTRPFAVIYEPFSGSGGPSGSIQSVAALTQRGEFAGFRVTSLIAGRARTDYILVLPDAGGTFEDAALGLSFRGRYAVATVGEHGECLSLYLGDGSTLIYRGTTLRSVSGAPTAASAELDGAAPRVTASAAAELTLPDGRRLSARRPASETP